MVLYYPVEYVHLTRTVPESRRKLERRTVTPGWVPPTAQGFLRELNRNELIARVEPCGTFCPHPEGYVFVAFWVFFYFRQAMPTAWHCGDLKGGAISEFECEPHRRARKARMASPGPGAFSVRKMTEGQIPSKIILKGNLFFCVMKRLKLL